MKWSFQIGKFFGIPVKVHLTFLLLLVFVGLGSGEKGGLPGGIAGIMVIISLFACVVLHEFGHSLMAQHFGIKVRDIILLPIGGVSQMEQIPDDPKKELYISVIGPLISLSLALLFFIMAKLFELNTSLSQTSFLGKNFLVNLFQINLILGLFNLLPAFPMDGGRVFRAFLALRMEYLQATHIAVSTGQIFAVLFFFYGLFYNFWLALIGIFIYLGAETEEHETILRRALKKISVRQAMITSFESLSPDDTLSRVTAIACHSLQMDFPVIQDNGLIGILQRDQLLYAMKEYTPETKVKDIMSTDFITIPESEPLEEAYTKINNYKNGFIPVMKGEKVLGLINLEQIGKYHILCSLGKK